jgi:hypothetical protein
MRRLLVLCALCAFALPAPALAYVSGAGDGTLVVRNGSSDDLTTPVVRLVAFHGAIFGQVDGGRIVIDDLTADSYVPVVTNYDSVHTVASDPSKKVWKGLNMRFRVDGGKYTISLYGSGIDLNAVGQPASGKVWLQGSATVLPSDGRYSIDGGDFRSLPDVGAWLPMGS